MNAESGFYTPLFTETGPLVLGDSRPVWSSDGSQVLIQLNEVLPDGEQPAIYSLELADPKAIPQLREANATDYSESSDGQLSTFARDGNIFIRFTGDDAPVQLTTQPEGTSCDSPFFDAEAINLFFICHKGSETVLMTQGVDGLLPVPTTIQPLSAASLGRDSGTLLLENGTGIYLSSIDGTVSLPLIELTDLRVRGG